MKSSGYPANQASCWKGRVKNKEQRTSGEPSNRLEGQRRSTTSLSLPNQNNELSQLLKTMISRGRKLIALCNSHGTAVP